MIGIGSHKQVVWIGSCGHEWTATVKSRVQGTGCPFCSHNRILPGFNDLAALYPEVAAEWSDRNLPLLPSMVTAFANRKVWWKCNKGHEWNTLISTRSYGSKCPYCSGIRLLKGYNDFATRQPELAKEWSERNLPLTPDEVNEKSQKNVWWKCKVCGFEWKSLVKSNDEKNEGISPTSISRNSLRSVWWKCPCGHSWKARVRDRTIEGLRCRTCEKEFHDAVPQLLVMLYAGRNGLKVHVNSDKEIGIPLEAYIPEISLAIESGGTASTDLIKDYICNKRGIKLVRVPHRKNGDEAVYAREIKQAFQKAHVYISSDERKDVDIIHKKFSAWRTKTTPTIENRADS
jgi:hypothetical protein